MRSLLILTMVLLGACSSAPRPVLPPVPVLLAARIAVDKAVNPDARGRPSPVVVRVYELKDEAAFRNADFFSLYERDQTLLGADLLNREEFVMRPGESRVLSRKLNVEARVLAVLVAYRDLEHAQWRASAPLPTPADATALGGKVSDALAGLKSAELLIAVGERKVDITTPGGR